MPAKIGPRSRQRRRTYLAEWREKRGLTQKQLAGRLETTDMTVSRWERGLVTFDYNAVAEALGIEPEDLWHHPDKPTANQLLRDQPPEVQEQAISLIRAIRRG